jgi:hypothetical protein
MSKRGPRFSEKEKLGDSQKKGKRTALKPSTPNMNERPLLIGAGAIKPSESNPESSLSFFREEALGFQG